jgi:hypothetical protein
MLSKVAVTMSAILAFAVAPPTTSAAAPASKSAARSSGETPRPLKNASPSGPLLFHGYACAGDCSSHQQGYAWASAHNISNPMDCRGTSETFIEGCRAFAGIEGPLGEREIFQDED